MATLTLALIKPETVLHPPICWAVIDRILTNGFNIVSAKRCRVEENKAEKFYESHRGRFFYNRLVRHMTGGPVLALVLSGENAINKWRQLLGSTKVYRTVHEDPSSIRGCFGLTDTRNVGHGCDSVQSFEQELPFFFAQELDYKNVVSREQLYQLVFSNFDIKDTRSESFRKAVHL